MVLLDEIVGVYFGMNLAIGAVNDLMFGKCQQRLDRRIAGKVGASGVLEPDRVGDCIEQRPKALSLEFDLGLRLPYGRHVGSNRQVEAVG